MRANRRRRVRTTLAFAAATAVLMVSRLIYAPPYLYFFDNANFALAIDHFDPGMHQPQPPGYPLFVGLLKLLDLFLHSANHDLILVGLIGSAAGLVLVWRWASWMFGNPAGWAAGALLMFNPVFWVAGIANPVRSFLVLIAAASGALSWRCLTEANPEPWFFGMSAALGFLSGFRPECLLILLPLWAATGWSRRVAPRAWAGGSLLLVASALLWVIPVATRMGGIEAIWTTFPAYLSNTSQGETLVFGAKTSVAAATIRRVLIWNFGLAIAWVWAVPFALRSIRARWTGNHTVCLTFSFVPAFVFHSLIYVRDVDQTLISIPVLCVVGGAALAGLRPRAIMLAGVTFAILATGWNFRWPMFNEMATASRGAVRFMNDWNRSTFSTLEGLRLDDDAVLIWDDSVVSWRQVCYYYPTRRLLALELDPPLWIAAHVGVAASMKDGAILVPSANRLVIGVSSAQGNALLSRPGSERRGPLVLVPWSPRSEVKVGR